MAKAVWDPPTTNFLVIRIEADPKLRSLCGWPGLSRVSSESTFSREFKEFAYADLPGRMYRALVEDAYRDAIIGHVSRDSITAMARERPAAKAETMPKYKRGRPPKGKERTKEPSWL
ncbi:MAG: hypothetical protein OXN84_14125 [Albidovulum sp.]|nr:hypothetical protein [Albidovulum sp.]MDE0530968.1 hypothetical protein [Albidovulum sp.]